MPAHWHTRRPVPNNEADLPCQLTRQCQAPDPFPIPFPRDYGPGEAAGGPSGLLRPLPARCQWRSRLTLPAHTPAAGGPPGSCARACPCPMAKQTDLASSNLNAWAVPRPWPAPAPARWLSSLTLPAHMPVLKLECQCHTPGPRRLLPDGEAASVTLPAHVPVLSAGRPRHGRALLRWPAPAPAPWAIAKQTRD